MGSDFGVSDFDVSTFGLTLDVTFPGSNSVEPVGIQPLSTRFHYFLGDDESKWQRNVSTFDSVVYRDIYNGVDLHIGDAPGGLLKYEFHSDPAAGLSYKNIQIRYDGVDELRIAESGELILETAFGTLRDDAPRAWQIIDGQRCYIPARFEMLDDCTYTIAISSLIDPALPLILDPEIAWMTYLGGSGNDWGFGVAIDDSGGYWVAGDTSSLDFEGGVNDPQGGSSDIFIARVNPEGTIDWMTYLGGNGGELTFDLCTGLAVDRGGSILVTGWTNAPDFAGANNQPHGLIDAFVLRLDPSGNLEWMTYLGGTADDLGFGVAVDASGRALVTGDAYSTNFDGANNTFHGGNYDAFAARVSTSGTLDWMTYLGGGDQDEANGIVVDTDGVSALVAGDTWSSNFEGRINLPIGQRDAFLARIHESGTIDWMTYQGGTGNEACYGITRDAHGAATIVGATTSTDFIGRTNAHHGGNSGIDGFVARIPLAGPIDWMTYLGGSDEDYALRIATDSAGAALVTGGTRSADYEGRTNQHHGGVDDVSFVRITPSGSVAWMTFLGGSGNDSSFGIVLDENGDALLTGRTNSPDFEGRNNAFHGGGSYGDAFLIKVSGINPSVIPGDIDGDGDVDFDDFSQLLASWGDPGCGGSLPCPADLDGDGDVDFDDFTTLLANWST